MIMIMLISFGFVFIAFIYQEMENFFSILFVIIYFVYKGKLNLLRCFASSKHLVVSIY